LIGISLQLEVAPAWTTHVAVIVSTVAANQLLHENMALMMYQLELSKILFNSITAGRANLKVRVVSFASTKAMLTLIVCAAAVSCTPPTPLSSEGPNVLLIGDSISMGSSG
jgi:hypothetical protein